MFTPSKLIVVGIAGIALVLAGAGPSSIDLGPQPAYAKNGTGGGNGKGGGGHGTRAGSTSSSSGPGKSASAPGRNEPSKSSPTVAKASPTAKANGNGEANGLDAKVAGLHAVNANLNAFMNASPNSRVGRIAAYAMAVVDVEGAVAAQEAAQETFDGATTTLTKAMTAWEASMRVLAEYGYGEMSSDALRASLDDLLAADTEGLSGEQLAAYDGEMAALEAALANANALTAAETAYGAANEALNDANKNLADAEGAAADTLNAAANANRTPVDDEVKMYVDTKLKERGILDYFRAQESEPPDVVVQ